MIVIWTKTNTTRTLASLSSILKAAPFLPVHVSHDYTVPGYTVPEGTSLIMALGADPLKKLQEEKIVAKNKAITSLRSLPHMRNGLPVMISYSPDIGEIDHGYYIDLLTDLTLGLRYALTKTWLPIYGTYKYVSDFSALCAQIEAQYNETGKPVDVSKDLETLGLDPYALPSMNYPGAYIVTMQASAKKGTAEVIRFGNRLHEEERLKDPAFQEQLEFLLNCPYIRLKGANFKYDSQWLRQRAKKTCKNFSFDTNLVGSLLDENRSNALDVHTKIYVPALAGYSDAFDAQIDKARMDLVPIDTLLPYTGGDVDATLQVAEVQKQELLRDQKLATFYVNILHPASRAFEEIEAGGVFVDLDAYQELKADLEKEHVRLVTDACKIMGGRIVIKHRDESKPGGMNLTKASMLCDFMFSPMGLNLTPKMYTEKPDKDGVKRPSTAMEHLEMFAGDPEAAPFIALIEEDSSVMKTYGTYVIGFLEHLRSDGRFHPNYFLYVGDRANKDEGGAKTGRLSCKAPAYQCMVPETEVLTDRGYLRLGTIVTSFAGGKKYKVKTHTGEWRDLIGVFNNGEKHVLRITTSSGKQITCTENHPVLTTQGWVEADHLLLGSAILTHRLTGVDDAAIRELGGTSIWSLDGLRETGFNFTRDVAMQMLLQSIAGSESRQSKVREHDHMRMRVGREESDPRIHTRQEVQDIPILGRHEDTLSESEVQRMGLLWRSGHTGVPTVAILRELLSRHGGDADRLLTGTQEPEWALRKGELHLDSQIRAKSEQEEFQEESVVCIEQLGIRHTFDLTIDDSHSFIANGVVVHNTIPKYTKWAKRIRRCFTAPPGYVVVERDYSQGELRVIACIANETNMIAAYKQGLDLHVKTPAPLKGLTYEQAMALEITNPEAFKELRQRGKAGNFGFVFGMREEGFIVYAKNNYHVDLDYDEAHTFRESFFDTYSGLLGYHAEYKRLAHRDKQVRSPLGRIRHLPLIDSPNKEYMSKAERQAINSPVQSTLTDMMIWSLAIENQVGLQSIAPCFGVCHDAANNYVPEDRVDEIVTRQTEIMENLPLEKVGWYPQLKFLSDAKFGPNMADLKGFKK